MDVEEEMRHVAGLLMYGWMCWVSKGVQPQDVRMWRPQMQPLTAIDVWHLCGKLPAFDVPSGFAHYRLFWGATHIALDQRRSYRFLDWFRPQ